MQVPGVVAAALQDGEEVAAVVALGGDDRLFVTPERSLVYRAGGVLSDESVETFPHAAERLTVSEGRRKATLTFEYPVEPDRELAVPLGRLEDVLQPLLAAVVRASGATDPGERVHRVFALSELTLVVTDERLFKHVGSVLWDDDHESIPFDDVTGLDYEEGTVATGVVFTVDGRKERLKTPNDRLPEVREHVESALLAARDLDSVTELEGDDPGAVVESDPGAAVADFGDVDPLDAGSGGPPGERSEETTDDTTTGEQAGGDGDDRGDDDGGGEETDEALASETEGANESRDGDESGTDAGQADGDGTETDAGRADGDETQDDDESGANGSQDESASDPGESEVETAFSETFEPAETEETAAAELAELRAAVERQNDLLERHSRAIEQLVEALREAE